MAKSMLIDTTQCIGCQSCEEACREANDLPQSEERKLSANTWTYVAQYKDVYVRKMCMHCLDPSCASVCPVAALRKTPEGPVIYEESRCMGCRYCMVACPFKVPTYEWDKAIPRVRKCLFCFQKRESKITPCAEACPTGATKFGDRDELLAEAKERIKAEPTKYVNHIFGENEAGGTSMLFLASTDFAELGFPINLGQDPLPMYTYRVLSKIPNVVVTAGVMLFGVWWLINRRMELAEEAEREKGTASH